MFSKTTVGYFNKKPIDMYRSKQGEKRVFFSGGIHHYENTRNHLHRLVQGEGIEGIDLLVVPEMNPGNFLGLNRCFNSLDMPNEYSFLRNLQPLDLAVDFHADFEATKFYMYERRKIGERRFGEQLFDRLYIPCRGYGVVEPEPEHTLEEIQFLLGARYSITTETPQGAFPNIKEEEEFNHFLAMLILEKAREIL